MLLLGVAVLAAGVAHAWSVALPWSGQPAWWLQLLALSGLILCLQGATSVRHAALLGWLFGVAWLCATFWWLFISMHHYGGLAAPVAVAAVFLLASALSLYLAAAMAAWHLWQPKQPLERALCMACLWLLAELARGRWFTGFPWGASGYAHADGPLAVLAPWVGAYGLGAAACFLGALCAEWLSHTGRGPRVSHPRGLRPLPLLVAVLAVLGALNLVRPSFSSSSGQIGVALLQGNISQDQKFQPGGGMATALRWYGEQMNASRQELTIAPETAIPLLLQQLPPDYWGALSKRFDQADQGLLVGMPAGNATAGYTNAAIGLRPLQPHPYRYDKHHLVPFGEFVPPLFRWFTQMMNIPLGDFVRGAAVQPPFMWRGQRIAPNICYEDLFGEELAARFLAPDQAPTLFANLSNIAWFGDGIAIDQHLAISRMRAMEFERPFVRATNTGATVIIDHRGVVTHALERGTRGVLTGTVQGREGLTPYARWAGNWGLWPLWLIGTAGAIFFALRARRTQPGPAQVQT